MELTQTTVTLAFCPRCGALHAPVAMFAKCAHCGGNLHRLSVAVETEKTEKTVKVN